MIELLDRVRELLGPRGSGEIEWRGLREPLTLAAPGSIEELRELVRWAAAEKIALAPIGTGSKLGWGRPPAPGTLALSTRRLQQIVEYEPGEGVLTALAGTRISSLRAAAREQGHWLTPDVAAAEAATLGGVIGAGQSGWDRVRFGPVRHHVLGVRCVMADASLTKSGGRLVKNVTGFDLHRLYCGSRGTLCVIVESTLRLFAAPREEALVRTRLADAGALAEHARAIERSSVRPYALVATREGPPRTPWTLHAHLGGLPGTLRAEVDVARGLWADCELVASAAREAAAQLRDSAFDASRSPCLHVACSPAILPAVLDALDRALSECEYANRTHVQPSLAVIDVALAPRSDAPEDKLTSSGLARLLEALRASLGALNVVLTLRNPTRKLAATSAPWPALGPGVALMQRVRERLDPQGVFARGRFTEEL